MAYVEEARRWTGAGVRDSGGDRVGRLVGVFADERTRRQYGAVRIKRGLLSRRTVLVPRDGAHAGNGDVIVAHEREVLRHAPPIEDDRLPLPAETRRLERHYGLERPAGGRDEDDARVGEELHEPSASDREPATGIGNPGVRPGPHSDVRSDD